MSGQQKAAHLQIRPLQPVGKRRVLAGVVLTPVVFFWLIVLAIFPKMKKYWNPSPIQVRVLGMEELGKVTYHGKASVTKYEPVVDHSENCCAPVFQPHQQSMLFVVDRPELLHNASEHTTRTIVRALEARGYNVLSLTFNVDDIAVIRML